MEWRVGGGVSGDFVLTVHFECPGHRGGVVQLLVQQGLFGDEVNVVVVATALRDEDHVTLFADVGDLTGQGNWQRIDPRGKGDWPVPSM